MIHLLARKFKFCAALLVLCLPVRAQEADSAGSEPARLSPEIRTALARLGGGHMVRWQQGERQAGLALLASQRDPAVIQPWLQADPRSCLYRWQGLAAPEVVIALLEGVPTRYDPPQDPVITETARRLFCAEPREADRRDLHRFYDGEFALVDLQAMPPWYWAQLPLEVRVSRLGPKLLERLCRDGVSEAWRAVSERWSKNSYGAWRRGHDVRGRYRRVYSHQREALAALVSRHLSSADPKARHYAAFGAALLGGAKLAELCRLQLVVELDPGVRVDLAHSLGCQGLLTEETVDAIVECLATAEDEALVQALSRDLLRYLERHKYTANWDVRPQPTPAAIRLKTSLDRHGLIEILAAGEASQGRLLTARLLAGRDQPASRRLSAKLVFDEDAKVRLAASVRLPLNQQELSVASVMRLSGDSDPTVRYRAIVELYRRRTLEAVPAFIDRLADDASYGAGAYEPIYHRNALAARLALYRLTGYVARSVSDEKPPDAEDVARAREWWRQNRHRPRRELLLDAVTRACSSPQPVSFLPANVHDDLLPLEPADPADLAAAGMLDLMTPAEAEAWRRAGDLPRRLLAFLYAAEHTAAPGGLGPVEALAADLFASHSPVARLNMLYVLRRRNAAAAAGIMARAWVAETDDAVRKEIRDSLRRVGTEVRGQGFTDAAPVQGTVAEGERWASLLRGFYGAPDEAFVARLEDGVGPVRERFYVEAMARWWRSLKIKPPLAELSPRRRAVALASNWRPPKAWDDRLLAFMRSPDPLVRRATFMALRRRTDRLVMLNTEDLARSAPPEFGTLVLAAASDADPVVRAASVLLTAGVVSDLGDLFEYAERRPPRLAVVAHRALRTRFARELADDANNARREGAVLLRLCRAPERPVREYAFARYDSFAGFRQRQGVPRAPYDADLFLPALRAANRRIVGSAARIVCRLGPLADKREALAAVPGVVTVLVRRKAAPLPQADLDLFWAHVDQLDRGSLSWAVETLAARQDRRVARGAIDCVLAQDQGARQEQPSSQRPLLQLAMSVPDEATPEEVLRLALVGGRRFKAPEPWTRVLAELSGPEYVETVAAVYEDSKRSLSSEVGAALRAYLLRQGLAAWQATARHSPRYDYWTRKRLYSWFTGEGAAPGFREWWAGAVRDSDDAGAFAMAVAVNRSHDPTVVEPIALPHARRQVRILAAADPVAARRVTIQALRWAPMEAALGIWTDVLVGQLPELIQKKDGRYKVYSYLERAVKRRPELNVELVRERLGAGDKHTAVALAYYLPDAQLPRARPLLTPLLSDPDEQFRYLIYRRLIRGGDLPAAQQLAARCLAGEALSAGEQSLLYFKAPAAIQDWLAASKFWERAPVRFDLSDRLFRGMLAQQGAAGLRRALASGELAGREEELALLVWERGRGRRRPNPILPTSEALRLPFPAFTMASLRLAIGKHGLRPQRPKPPRKSLTTPPGGFWPGPVPATLIALAGQADSEAAGLARRCLAYYEGGNVPLRSLTRSPHPWIALSAVTGLAQFRDPADAPALAEAARHPHPAVRGAAVWVLGLSPARAQYVEHFNRIAADPKADHVARAGAIHWGNLAPAVLARLVADPNPMIALAAMRKAADTRAPDCLAPLREAARRSRPGPEGVRLKLSAELAIAAYK